MSNVNCVGCTNCTGCWNCTNCVGCVGCENCTDCTDCGNCVYCVGLTGYEGLIINPAKDADNPRFMEAIAVLSTISPWRWVTNVGVRDNDGEMFVNVPKEKSDA